MRHAYVPSIGANRWIHPHPHLSQTTSAFPQHNQQRNLHYVPTLGYDDSFKQYGVPGLYSKEGYRLAWTEYQGMIVSKLNELVAGEVIENSDVKTLTHQFARDPMNASIFNHASMAHNNHLFFQTLSMAPAELAKVPQLQDSLIRAFGSIETLKMTMLDTAAAMFGPGFVWLVYARAPSGVHARGFGARAGSWKILNTYLAGTPYPEAGFRQQGIDMNNATPDSLQAYMRSQHLQPTNYAGSFGAYSQIGLEQAKLPPGGTSLMPVLCVNTWEHAYMYDCGLLGKREYLEKWWKAIDWGVVEQNTPIEAKQFAFQRS